VRAEQPPEGLLVEMPTSISTESTGRLRSELLRPLKDFEQGAARQGGKFVLVCDFNPEGRRSDCDDFGACYELAKYIRKLQGDLKGIHTVAYVHGDVRRHSVLPVLACKEIIFSENGRLGPVVAGGEPLPDAEQAAYAFITRGRYSPVLVRKLYDPALEVVKVGGEYLDANQKPRPRGQPVPGLALGEPAVYTFALAKQLGLIQQMPFPKLEDVRLAYGLPRTSAARSLERTTWRRILLDGSVNGELVEQTMRRVKQALRDRPNVLLFEIRCAGGSAEKAHELGMFLASLNERKEHPVETVAFVTSKARNLAAFLAFGCNKIVMQREDDKDVRDPDDADDSPSGEARLGGFNLYISRHPSVDPLRKELEKNPANRNAIEQRLQAATSALEGTLKEQLAEILTKQNYPVALAAGMFDRDVRLHLVELAKGAAGGQKVITEDELKADQQGEKLWRDVKLVKPWEGQPRFDKRYLTLTARQAKELAVAQDVVKDLPDLFEHERVNADDVKSVEADWLDGLADFLREPWTSAVLVMIGITCLILELKMPGVGLPGVLAAICFVLFFWAHSQLHGQITWLAILLFVLGLVLIGIEIFALPGFGVCGISGVLLVLASLGLVAYGHWPRTTEEWMGFGNKIGPFGVSLLGSLVLVFLLVRYLPHIPVLNRLVPHRAEEDDATQEPENPLHAELQGLLGAIGVAATPLRPAGKTQFGDSFIDVVAEGGYVMPGTRVQVIEVEGNRVVVKEV
jgi:hypothetical protein